MSVQFSKFTGLNWVKCYGFPVCSVIRAKHTARISTATKNRKAHLTNFQPKNIDIRIVCFRISIWCVLSLSLSLSVSVQNVSIQPAKLYFVMLNFLSLPFAVVDCCLCSTFVFSFSLTWTPLFLLTLSLSLSLLFSLTHSLHLSLSIFSLWQIRVFVCHCILLTWIWPLCPRTYKYIRPNDESCANVCIACCCYHCRCCWCSAMVLLMLLVLLLLLLLLLFAFLYPFFLENWCCIYINDDL